MSIQVILHNIRSAHNVGAIFRTADGAGVEKIYLTGYTPTPLDRFGRMDPTIQKTALGATESVPFEVEADIDVLMSRLRGEGIKIVAVEQDPQAIDYRTMSPASRVAFIFGNEVEGISEEVCSGADEVVHIPMHGKKESLNVSVAAGIILFEAQKH
jgi:23S rRNA (guanosine2251-2'-O)-methyltransferase